MRRLLRCSETVLVITAPLLHDGLFALADGLQINRNGAVMDAVVRATSCQSGHPGAGNHRFRGGTAHIDADTAKVVALDERHFAACLREGNGEELASPTGPDHNRIIRCSLWHPTLSLLLPPCTGAFVSPYASARTTSGESVQIRLMPHEGHPLHDGVPCWREIFLLPPTNVLFGVADVIPPRPSVLE